MKDSPHVFVSYSWDSEQHIRRVLEITQWLRREGVAAWVDKFETSPKEGWPTWCYRQVEKASYVLVVCTEKYRQRVQREQDDSTEGRGATLEGALITNSIYDDVKGQTKFIPVVFSNSDRNAVPYFLKGYTIYDVGGQAGAVALYRHLTGQKEHVPEVLGSIRPPEEVGSSAAFATNLPPAVLGSNHPPEVLDSPRAAHASTTESAATPGVGFSKISPQGLALAGDWLITVYSERGQVKYHMIVQKYMFRHKFMLRLMGPTFWGREGWWHFADTPTGPHRLVAYSGYGDGWDSKTTSTWEAWVAFSHLKEGEMGGLFEALGAQGVAEWIRTEPER